MTWKEITHKHNGLRVRVWADSTPKHPIMGEAHEGVVQCADIEDALPLLRQGNRVRMFAPWWNVTVIR